MAAAGILAVVIVAYGATHVMSGRPRQHHSEVAFNWFTNVRNACDKDDGNLVTTDPHGTPMAFATPDGPQRYWCVSKDYLAAIGRAPRDPLPPVRTIPREYKWLWPRTTYGQ